MPEANLPVAPSFFVTTTAKHQETPAALNHSLLVARDHSRQPATTNNNAHRNPGSGPYEADELTEEQ
jgi:hypothetical protein